VFASETGAHLIRPPVGSRWAAHLRTFDAAAYEQRLAAAGFSFVATIGRGIPVAASCHPRSAAGALCARLPRTSIFSSRPAVAIVGARACSGYGASVARTLARDLARSGLVVVSGLARGIDAEAHRGALEGGGATIAVLGCGIDRDYPAAHAELARRIAATGLIVAEYAPGVVPAPWRFPARNRIVAGLAAAAVVVEARERSGALITADLALEEGREVFAVPGEITSGLSAGTNALLKLGASPLTCANDLLSCFELELTRADRCGCRLATPPGSWRSSASPQPRPTRLRGQAACPRRLWLERSSSWSSRAAWLPLMVCTRARLG